jgi:hypothetical protein
VSTITKITFPATAPGEVRIRVYLDGKLTGPVLIVGHAIRDANGWDVHLWPRVNEFPFGRRAVMTRAKTLTDLRAKLLERIRVSGRWWQVDQAAGHPPLSERETAALLALASLSVPVTGNQLASRMRENGRETASTAGAHQAANALADSRLRLAIKGYSDGPVKYEITNLGREQAGRIRAAS